jgi:hypothetical protein
MAASSPTADRPVPFVSKRVHRSVTLSAFTLLKLFLSNRDLLHPELHPNVHTVGVLANAESGLYITAYAEFTMNWIV